MTTLERDSLSLKVHHGPVLVVEGASHLGCHPEEGDEVDRSLSLVGIERRRSRHSFGEALSELGCSFFEDGGDSGAVPDHPELSLEVDGATFEVKGAKFLQDAPIERLARGSFLGDEAQVLDCLAWIH